MRVKNKAQKGQSFIELIAALAVISIVLVVLVGLVTKSIANTTFSRNKSLATSYAEEAFEWLRGERDRGWSTSFYAQTANNWCIVSLNWSTGGSHSGTCGSSEFISGTIFRRNLSFNRINAATVDATITVSWSDSIGNHETTTTTTYTNWKGNP